MSQRRAAPVVVGTTLAGSKDERSAAQAVQRMFDEIAPTYDLANDVLSAGIDRLWWRRTARSFRDILSSRNAEVLDLCCGTGAMALALHRVRPADGVAILAADFSHQMLKSGMERFAANRILPLEADALNLPFADSRFQLVTSAFGFRNLANYDAGLREIYRVLGQRGEVGILDFSEPDGFLGVLYRQYFKHILPFIGSVISGKKAPYQYLPVSVERFPSPPEMLDRMQAAGFVKARWIPYSFGIAGLYRGVKP